MKTQRVCSTVYIGQIGTGQSFITLVCKAMPLLSCSRDRDTGFGTRGKHVVQSSCSQCCLTRCPTGQILHKYRPWQPSSCFSSNPSSVPRTTTANTQAFVTRSTSASFIIYEIVAKNNQPHSYLSIYDGSSPPTHHPLAPGQGLDPQQ